MSNNEVPSNPVLHSGRIALLPCTLAKYVQKRSARDAMYCNVRTSSITIDTTVDSIFLWQAGRRQVDVLEMVRVALKSHRAMTGWPQTHKEWGGRERA